MLDKKLLSYISDPENFELKQATDEAVAQLLHDCRQELMAVMKDGSLSLQIPKETGAIPRKLNKGNNHKGYPFMLSDFPCVFSKAHTFSFRIMVWYGQYFSISLLLSGRFKASYKVPEQLYEQVAYQIKQSNSLWDDDIEKEVLYLNLNQWRSINQESSQSLQIIRKFRMAHLFDLPDLAKNCFVHLLQSQ